MKTTEQRPFASRFAIRFAIILALAMLPAGVIAFVQTRALQSEVQARSEIGLLGATLQAAAVETSLIGRARGMVGSLAGAMPYVLDDPKACNDLMLRVGALEPAASLVAFVPVSGKMTCSSSGKQFDYSGIPLFHTIISKRQPSFFVTPHGPRVLA